MKLIWKSVIKYKLLLTAVVCWSILGLAAQMGSTGYISIIMNKTIEMISEGNRDILVPFIVRSCIVLLILVAVYSSSTVLINLYASRLSANVGRDLREAIYERVMEYSMEEINFFSISSLITRSTNDIQKLQGVIYLLLICTVPTPIIVIGGLLCVQNYQAGMEWTVALAVISTCLVFFVIFALVQPIIRKNQIYLDDLNQISRESITGVQVIRAFHREKWNQNRMQKVSGQLCEIGISSGRILLFTMPAITFIMNIISVIIIYASLNRVSAGIMEVGVVSAYISFTQMIIMGFMMLATVAVSLPRVLVSAKRVSEVLERKSNLKEGKEQYQEDQAGLSFEHVSYRYTQDGGYVLKDITFQANVGETTAIIGPTGCGKSTVLKLIPRLLDSYEGSIRIGEKDSRELAVSELRKNIGYVPQQTMLLSGTIRSNILFSAKEDTEENMREAARISQSLDFIEQKDYGFEEPVAQRGSNLSGGQRQRLSIARALARDARIYLFDDSFSALDYKTDAALRCALQDKTKKAAVIIVAQRVSSILHSDKILVMKNGEIIGQGTHKELMRNCRFYQEIAASQMLPEDLKRSMEE